MDYKIPKLNSKIFRKWWFWAIIAFIFLEIVNAGSFTKTENNNNLKSSQQVEKKQELVANKTPTTQEQPIAQNINIVAKPSPVKEVVNTEAIKSNGLKLYSVTKVVDGDTISVNMDGEIETLRLIGINTPETVDPRKPVECFGKEASDKAKQLLTGKKVYLEADATQGERDKYQRLLRYVWLEDGTFFNKLMISDGYAFEYTYNTPYKYQTEFKQAEQEARTTKKGLWADNVCDQTKIQVPAQTITSQPVDTSKINCTSNTYNCTDFKTQKEAQQVFDFCGGVKNDIHKLDGDKDGIVCENLP